ncbi:hypothetical protein NDU88_011929 [Pleurodeles waltl]|uniref:Uncharacterized protein n=1 Tax=Pleurodeles waltl TaxID=8319 RepID=A0AAV7R025_PLEWA|nr:hypothetical protein NDU88_011929 [Pleurodeles waltl]
MENKGTVQSKVIEWEAYKAALRAIIIAGGVRDRRERTSKLLELEGRVIQLDREEATNRTSQLVRDLELTREDYRLRAWNEVKLAYMAYNKSISEAGNKAEAEVLDSIKDCPVKRLCPEQREELEADMTVEEIALAMGQTQTDAFLFEAVEHDYAPTREEIKKQSQRIMEMKKKVSKPLKKKVPKTSHKLS